MNSQRRRNHLGSARCGRLRRQNHQDGTDSDCVPAVRVRWGVRNPRPTRHSTSGALPTAAQSDSTDNSALSAGFQSLGQMPRVWPAAGTYSSAISGDGSTIMGYGWVCADGTTTCTSSDFVKAFAGRCQAHIRFLAAKELVLCPTNNWTD